MSQNTKHDKSDRNHPTTPVKTLDPSIGVSPDDPIGVKSEDPGQTGQPPPLLTEV